MDGEERLPDSQFLVLDSNLVVDCRSPCHDKRLTLLTRSSSSHISTHQAVMSQDYDEFEFEYTKVRTGHAVVPVLLFVPHEPRVSCTCSLKIR